jgi:hypothetical protein
MLGTWKMASNFALFLLHNCIVQKASLQWFLSVGPCPIHKKHVPEIRFLKATVTIDNTHKRHENQGNWSGILAREFKWGMSVNEWSDVKCCDMQWIDAIYVKWFCFEVKWSEVSYVEVLKDKSNMHIRVTL